MTQHETRKNRTREAPTFANINLLGKCNVDCHFCLGKDIEKELEGQDQRFVPFKQWENFMEFLLLCEKHSIDKLYITGQNCDSLQYGHLEELVAYLHYREFKVGLRTNGYLAERRMSVINSCELSTGYSIHTLSPRTNTAILGRSALPKWGEILNATKRPRVQIVLNRYNEYELMDVLRWLKGFPHVRYVEVRRVSTDTRTHEMRPDMEVYDRTWRHVDYCFGPPITKLWGDADVYQIHGHDVVFWRTVKTSINSFNYFTDGTISDEYFVVEGYLKNRSRA
jgi:molybdenum cofactor biosynthesis enzyme MoaA